MNPSNKADRSGKINWELAVVEGMVVVVIIGMLLAIAIPQYRLIKEKRLIDRAKDTCELLWQAETGYLARYDAFKEVRGSQEIEAPMPEGLGIKIDRSLPFYFAAIDSTVMALGIDNMLGTTIIFSPRRRPEWQIKRENADRR